jgi:hypothetical protein
LSEDGRGRTPGSPEPDAGDVALELAAGLEQASVPYAIGGALAYGMYSVPRATLDVDVNVFVEPPHLDQVFRVAQDLGLSVDEALATKAAIEEGLFVAWRGSTRVDFFTPSIAFSWEALRTRQRLTFRGREAWFLSPESLAVFKLLFFRPKDLADLERLVGTAGASMNLSWVRQSIVDMLGPEDQRIAAWDGMVRDFASP